MADRISAERRSWNMSRIKSKDTGPERLVRSFLFKAGYRFRKNDKRYPGKPDIVLPKYGTVIFVHGCFWHRHKNCRQATIPKTNTEFWEKKFQRNVALDEINRDKLISMGWKVITLWECEIENNFEDTMSKLLDTLQSNKR